MMQSANSLLRGDLCDRKWNVLQGRKKSTFSVRLNTILSLHIRPCHHNTYILYNDDDDETSFRSRGWSVRRLHYENRACRVVTGELDLDLDPDLWGQPNLWLPVAIQIPPLRPSLHYGNTRYSWRNCIGDGIVTSVLLAMTSSEEYFENNYVLFSNLKNIINNCA